MKTITYRGRQYEAPDWVEWATTGIDGRTIGYEKEPVLSDAGWFCEPYGGATPLRLADTNDWKESLEKV